ncbi:MAG TPA: ATP-dependent zinc metalloprotease FtsH [Myxococcota bacterium]|nr:ATP-dependent zinc metalloprotease FtsH [Myxococcota bacterium]
MSQPPAQPQAQKSEASAPPPRTPRPKPPNTPEPTPRISPLSWLFLLALLGWNVWAFVVRPGAQLELPYSEFLAQVRAGNVTKVHIVGDAIDGAFAKPIAWPRPEPGAEKPTAAPPAQSAFHTTFPSSLGDSGLVPLLEAHQVTIDVESPAAPWLGLVLTSVLPILLMVGLLGWMGRQAARSQAGMFGFGRNRARRYEADRPKVTFAEVAGADEAKADLAEVVDFLRRPAKYLEIGAHIPRGVLLVGPPGTGKTLLARAVAGEAGVPFFSISGSEFVEMFVGVGASRVRDLFVQAKAAEPSIVFIDELDAVGRRRGAGVGQVNDEREQTLNQLLVEMDGFDARQELIILAATNRPDVLDPALLRPGRFDRQVVVPLPDWRGRLGILRIHTRHLHLAPDIDLERLARTATGLSGADLANLCNEAALGAARRDRSAVSMEDFERAWDKIVLGAERSTALSPRDRRVVAYHEGGHALVAWLTPAADPVRKVTIVPRGRALGVTEQLPAEDRYNMSKTELLARLDVMLGGREAESLVMGDITTGAENDLIQATQLARRMITRWGMGGLGALAFQGDEEHPFLGYQLSQGRDYSEATAARVDREVEQLLAGRQAGVRQLLEHARERLDALAETLLKEETVSDRELEQILGPRAAASAP